MGESARTKVLDVIQLIVRRELNNPGVVVSESTTASDVEGWDSLTHVLIIVGVEKHFGIRLKSSEVAQLVNAGSLVDIVLDRGCG